MENCQQNAKAYIDSVKVGEKWLIYNYLPFQVDIPKNEGVSSLFFQDYELQLLMYKAVEDPTASPLKKPKIQAASDEIIQEVLWSSLV